jgi:hypothetical protein
LNFIPPVTFTGKILIPNMKTALRVLLVFFAFIAFYYFIYWVPLTFIPGIRQTGFLANIIALLLAGAIAVFLWKKTGSPLNGLASSILLGGIILGGIGFVGGFFGPIIFYPEVNLGPLIGIFYSGPIGFVVGLVAGGVYWLVKRKKGLPGNLSSTGAQ